MAADFEQTVEAFTAKVRQKTKRKEIRRAAYREVLADFRSMLGASGEITQEKIERREKAKKVSKTLATIHQNDKVAADLAAFVDLPDLEIE